MKSFFNRILVAFQFPAFRWLWLSLAVLSMSMNAGNLAMGWLVLELTDSAFWVGAVAACRGIAQVAFGVFAGVLLDRYDKRHVLLIAVLLFSTVPILLGWLIVTEQIQLWHLIAASLIDGLIVSVRAPAVSTIMYEIVGPKAVLNANAAKNLSFSISSIFGSILTGYLIKGWGEQSALFLAGILGLCAFVLLLFIRGSFRATPKKEPVLQAAREGVRYVWQTHSLRKLLTMSVVMETLGFSYHVMLPVVARDVLGLDASGLGLLSSARGVGSAVSNIGVASLGDYEQKSRLLVGTAGMAGIVLIAFGLSPIYALSIALIFMMGAMMTAYDVTMNSMMLMIAEDEWRGRVQAIYTLTYGFVSLGGFVAGSIATVAGAPIALALNGGLILLFIGRNARPLLKLSQPQDPIAIPTD